MKTFSFDVVSNATKRFLLCSKVQLALHLSHKVTLDPEYLQLIDRCYAMIRKSTKKLIKKRIVEEAKNLAFLYSEMNAKDEFRFKSTMCRIQALSALLMFKLKNKSQDVETQIEELALNSIVNAMSLIPEFDFDGFLEEYKPDESITPAILIPDGDDSWYRHGKSGLPDRKDKKAKIE